MRIYRHALALFLLSTLLVSGLGCSNRAVSFNDPGGDYTAESIGDVVDDLPENPALGKPVSQAEDLRHEALVELRAMGGGAAVVTDLLTAQFPPPIRSVPFHVEAGTFEGTSAWIIVEVWGSEGGNLDETRVWVFDRETEEVLFTVAIN